MVSEFGALASRAPTLLTPSLVPSSPSAWQPDPSLHPLLFVVGVSNETLPHEQLSWCPRGQDSGTQGVLQCPLQSLGLSPGGRGFSLDALSQP